MERPFLNSQAGSVTATWAQVSKAKAIIFNKFFRVILIPGTGHFHLLLIDEAI